MTRIDDESKASGLADAYTPDRPSASWGHLRKRKKSYAKGWWRLESDDRGWERTHTEVLGQFMKGHTLDQRLLSRLNLAVCHQAVSSAFVAKLAELVNAQFRQPFAEY